MINVSYLCLLYHFKYLIRYRFSHQGWYGIANHRVLWRFRFAFVTTSRSLTLKHKGVVKGWGNLISKNHSA